MVPSRHANNLPDPSQVVVLLVGINNSLESKPWKALEFLVEWMRVAMPRTKVLILAPLPNFLGTSDTFRVQYRCVGAGGCAASTS